MKLLILDGNSIINRAFYGIRQLCARRHTYKRHLRLLGDFAEAV